MFVFFWDDRRMNYKRSLNAGKKRNPNLFLLWYRDRRDPLLVMIIIGLCVKWFALDIDCS